MLKEAQRDPVVFCTLTVRMVGYSTRVVALSTQVQEGLLARMEHGLWCTSMYVRDICLGTSSRSLKISSALVETQTWMGEQRLLRQRL